MTDIKKEAKALAAIAKDANKHQFDDGGVVEVKGSIKKKGKILKLELRYDQDFIEDNVHITVKAGCKEINILSPEKSDGFTASFCATKSF